MLGVLVGFSQSSSREEIMAAISNGLYVCKDKGFDSVIPVLNPDTCLKYTQDYHDEVLNTFADVVQIGSPMASLKVPKNHIMYSERGSVRDDGTVFKINNPIVGSE